MKDLKIIVLDKKKYTLPILVLIYSILTIISGFTGVKELSEILLIFNISQKTAGIIFGILMLPIVLIALFILVNIVYLIIKFSLKIFENKEIKDKKYLKYLIYKINLISSIILALISVATSMVINNTQTLTTLGNVNEVFVGLLSFYMLFIVLKDYLKTEKVYKILPITFYLFTVISSIISILK